MSPHKYLELMVDKLKKLLLLLTLLIFTLSSLLKISPSDCEKSKLSLPNLPSSLKLPHLPEPKFLALLLFVVVGLTPSSRADAGPFRKENVHARDNDRPTYGPSNTVVGEGIMVNLESSRNNLGGRSKPLQTALFLEDGGFAAASDGGASSASAVALGLPGASSHWNGIETDGRSGGVCICLGGSLGLQYGSLDKVSLGVEFGS